MGLIIAFFAFMVAYHQPSERLTRFAQSTASKRFHTKARCVIYCGLIQKKSTAGECRRVELATSLVETYVQILISQMESMLFVERTNSLRRVINGCFKISLSRCGQHQIIVIGVGMLQQS